MNQPKHAVNIIRVGDEWLHYHAEHNFSLPASQLVCPLAYQTCSPDYLHSYRAPFVHIKGGTDGARLKIISFHKNSFWKRDVLSFFFSLCDSKPRSLPPLLTLQAISTAPFDRLSGFQLVFLNIRVSSLSLCIPRFPLTWISAWLSSWLRDSVSCCFPNISFYLPHFYVSNYC